MNCTQPVRRALVFAAALVCLSAATKAQAVPCDGGVLDLKPGSTLDLGWTGNAHGGELPTGSSLAFEVLHRCSDDLSPCGTDSDCANNDCEATCDCEGDTSCEIAGPAGPRKCVTTLADCVSDADCPLGVPCATLAGPPMPISAGGAPICVVRRIDGPWTGTFDAATGDLSAGLAMRWSVFLGITLDQPCPSCGAPGDNPEIGDVFNCSGGLADGASCTVEGVSLYFGGTSSDCPPEPAANVTGAGLAIRFPELTTGTATRTAQLPCSALPGNPLVSGSNPKCTDMTGAGDPVCASNADCTRCTGDPSIACTGNADCVGNGTCAEAPEQPITCGYWCHCGFCNNNPSLPCFSNGECPMGQTCVVGTGALSSSNAPQSRPNNCGIDGFVCGGTTSESCETDTTNVCSDQPYRNCSVNADCDAFAAGTCDAVPLSCFESRITRTGQPSALGGYCREDRASCAANVDCVTPGDVCVADSSASDPVGLFCSSGTSSSTINVTLGVTGPGAVSTAALVQLCRCDDVQPGCEDLCASLEPYCGDGVTEGLEACDSEPCCASDCTLAIAGSTCRTAVNDCDVEEVCNGVVTFCPPDELAADDTPCDDGLFCTEGDVCVAGQCEGAARDCADANACTVDTCDELANVCESEETPLDEGSCLVAPKASFQIRDSATPGKDKLSWKWNGGAAFEQSDLGTPLVDTTYTLCVFDQTSGTPSLEAALEIAPSATLWLDKDPRGLLYKDKPGTSDGVTRAQLKPGVAGKSRVKLSASGTSLVLPAPAGSVYFNQTPSVVVQLVNSEGTCWTSSFESADTRSNESDAFKAQVK